MHRYADGIAIDPGIPSLHVVFGLRSTFGPDTSEPVHLTRAYETALGT